MSTTQPQPAAPSIPDKADRDRAIRERLRNVVMDAGAGTGKTTILVERAVEMVAPEDDGPAYPLSRIAALTFTRKAAGELRLRLRERILARLSESKLTGLRRGRLKAALDDIDLAFVGTIHSFADRLLRLRPVEAWLSPTYEIAEDTESLVVETAAMLVEGAQTGALPTLLAGTSAESFAEEATQTIIDALVSGIRREDSESDWGAKYGLSGLISAFVHQRDVVTDVPRLVPFDQTAFREAASAFLGRLHAVDSGSPGGRWLLATGRLVEAHLEERDPLTLRQALVTRLRGKPPSGDASKPRLGIEFGGDKAAWAAWQAFDDKKKCAPAPTLREQILAPLDEWLAIRLARLFPVAIALYEQVKARHGVVDQIDLLLKLRELLASDPVARERYQRLFDHVFIDEFQDTDPLQAEIVMFLCEEGAMAERFADIEPAPGRLTLVGDPKQSIYRFRRADIAMYERVRGMVAAHEHVSIRLAANFRSKASLIDWFNRRFEKLLGPAEEGSSLFNVATGEVAYQPLVAGRPDDEGASVHVLPIDVTSTDKPKAADYRRAEAQALAHYLRWLTEHSELTIADPATSAHRPIRYGDIAILAASTSNLHFLFPELDTMGVPHSIRGGKLFLNDPLHRQLLLACCALADADDGVAFTALLRPPFFALDLADLAAEKSLPKELESQDPRVLRVREAKAALQELRRRRFDRSPGTTLRELLEKTAIARLAAMGQNGEQRVERLYELCFYVDTLAAGERLDFDATAERMRTIALDPVQLDPPHPIGGGAVQILTMHQSKGLEFPVTVLWDGRALLRSASGGGAFRVDRDGVGWAISLDGLAWEEAPPGSNLKQRDTEYANAEKKRLIYVGATRARDLLVFAKIGKQAEGLVAAHLLGKDSLPYVHELETYVEDKGAEWTADIAPARPVQVDATTRFDEELAMGWREAIESAALPKLAPAAVSKQEQPDSFAPKRQKKRFGREFGNTVHAAIAAVLQGRAPSASEAVRYFAQEYGLEQHVEDAIRDVERALEALEREGLVKGPAAIRLEYPVALASDDGQELLTGYIDFVAAKDGTIDVLDFKTDPAPSQPAASEYPAYVQQVRTYGEMLTRDRSGMRLGRVGLLFTEDGGIRWC